MTIRQLILTLLLLLGVGKYAVALDHIVFMRDGRRIRIQGELIVEAGDGGLLVLDSSGILWAVQPEEKIEHRKDGLPLEHLDKEELSVKLLKELPPGFSLHSTPHYLICYNTSKAYAQWCGSLYERLYRGFFNYWENLGLELSPPDHPLIALVFANQQDYSKYAQSELGKATNSVIGYFSLRMNRVAMYDLAGIESLRRPGDRRATAAQINQILARPNAERTVATIIHEATHQLAFNSGLHQRYADIPLWVSEGVAIYFETPDLKRRKGWKSIGKINRLRLERFRQYLRRRSEDSLVSLLADDRRFHGDAEAALDAYAESWALSYYLIRRQRENYVKYLKMLSQKKPLLHDPPVSRLNQFKAALGTDLKKLDANFLRMIQRLR